MEATTIINDSVVASHDEVVASLALLIIIFMAVSLRLGGGERVMCVGGIFILRADPTRIAAVGRTCNPHNSLSFTGGGCAWHRVAVVEEE
eukprot:scaffold14778_cov151-Skeletonema_dohrnii-CCMP3373.AAC.3